MRMCFGIVMKKVTVFYVRLFKLLIFFVIYIFNMVLLVIYG